MTHTPAPTDVLLFDMDGTLIDSMPLHELAWADWHARHGLPFEGQAFFEATAGRSNTEVMGELLPRLDATAIAAEAKVKEGLYRERALTQLQAIKGALDYLRRARAAGHRMAVCTASMPDNIALATQRFGLDELVETIVCPADARHGGAAGELLRGKPHPDIFLEAARRLGADPAQCLVFEDAPLGVEAARRAGMRAVALTTTLPASAFETYDNVSHVMADFCGYAPLTPPAP
ncbi:HAD family hydrolase [Amphibiibacter pelophylacis]|uniref:HAD family phosphatase n=1 Tax=Amphibiibacter pelophylacis TaxID=1799477 RepID=A0ACC6P105_9BURK